MPYPLSQPGISPRIRFHDEDDHLGPLADFSFTEGTKGEHGGEPLDLGTQELDCTYHPIAIVSSRL